MTNGDSLLRRRSGRRRLHGPADEATSVQWSLPFDVDLERIQVAVAELSSLRASKLGLAQLLLPPLPLHSVLRFQGLRAFLDRPLPTSRSDYYSAAAARNPEAVRQREMVVAAAPEVGFQKDLRCLRIPN